MDCLDPSARMYGARAGLLVGRCRYAPRSGEYSRPQLFAPSLSAPVNDPFARQGGDGLQVTLLQGASGQAAQCFLRR